MVKHFSSFNEATIQAVWEKATIVIGRDPNKVRKDANDAWIHRDKYGVTDSEIGNGWEIDHIIPVSKGGSNHLSNLQPLQWRNNRCKSDNYPFYDYCVTAA